MRALSCPTCFAPLVDDEGVPMEEGDIAEKRRKCPACTAPLWCADGRGPRRYPLADYLRRRHRGYFQLFVADEAHELKSRGSAQGLAAASLVDACGTTLALSGTVFGGYSSTLFHLLRRFSPAVRAEFTHREEGRWVSRYGIVHRITKRSPDAYTEDGRQSKRRNYVTRIVEKPGIAPAVLFHLLPNTVFLRLSDVDLCLPPYAERVTLFPLDGAAQGDTSHAAAYRKLAAGLLSAVRAALAKGSKRLLAVYLQTLLSYPDGCTHAETVLDKGTGDVIAAAPALSPDVVYPKERALLDLVRRQRIQGRRVVVYVANTDTRDITPRLKELLERDGVRVAVLKSHTVTPERREEWLARQVEEGAEVLLCHPKLVQTGLDLLDWATYVFFQVEYSVYVMRQASRRGWRIGQTQPVEVYHFAYEGTLQAEALALVAAKLRAAVLLDGELPEDGLAALDDDGEDLFLALARRLAANAPTDSSSLEALFARAQQSRAEDDDFLAGGGWNEAEAPTGPAGEPGASESLGPALSPSRAAPPAQLTLSSDEPSVVVSGQVPGGTAGGKVLSFAELAQLVRRPQRKPRPVPAGQLPLLAS